MMETWKIVDRGLSFLVAFLPAAVWHWQTARGLSRGQTLFAARVEPGFAETGAGQAILKQFRWHLWSWSLAGAAASTLLPVDLAEPLGPMISMLAGSVAYALANRRTRREAAAAAEPTVRVASLAAEARRETAWLGVVDWLAMLVPPAAPAATLLFLACHWHQTLTDAVAAPGILPVCLGLMIGLMCSATQWALRFRARSSDWAPTQGASRKYRTYLGALHAFVLPFITLQLCIRVVMPFKGTVAWLSLLDMPTYFLGSIPAWVAVLVCATGMRFWLTKHLATQCSDPMSDSCWKWGRIYFNPGDPALVVPRRTGVGPAFNCARPSVLVGGIVFTAFSIVVLVRVVGVMMLVGPHWPN